MLFYAIAVSKIVVWIYYSKKSFCFWFISALSDSSGIRAISFGAIHL